MLLHALGTVLPLAVAMALSSVPVLAMLAAELSPRAKAIAVPFLIGTVLGLAFVVGLLTVGALAIPASNSPGSVGADAAGLILVGLATIGTAVVVWRQEGGTEPPAEPKWMGALNKVGPWGALGIAFGLGLRPKSLLLSAAVALALRGESLSLPEIGIVLGFYLVIASSTVTVPIIWGLLSPVKSAVRLRMAKESIVLHGRVITVVILLLIGVVILGEGLTRVARLA